MGSWYGGPHLWSHGMQVAQVAILKWLVWPTHVELRLGTAICFRTKRVLQCHKILVGLIELIVEE